MCCTLLESDVVSRVSLGSEVFAVGSKPKREEGCRSVRTTLVPIAAVGLLGLHTLSHFPSVWQPFARVLFDFDVLRMRGSMDWGELVASVRSVSRLASCKTATQDVNAPMLKWLPCG